MLPLSIVPAEGMMLEVVFRRRHGTDPLRRWRSSTNGPRPRASFLPARLRTGMFGGARTLEGVVALSRAMMHSNGAQSGRTFWFVSLEDYRRFRDVGLRGLAPDGMERSGARDRNGLRNALFAELLVVTGLRLEEASSLLASEVCALRRTSSPDRQIWFDLPAGLTKGDRGRAILMPSRLLEQLRVYITVERAHAVDKFKTRAGWRAMERPIFIRCPAPGARSLALRDGGAVPLEAITPEERGRLIICRLDGEPIEPAALWVTEVGQPVRPNSWEVAFARASRRCAANGFTINVRPHQLRHTFAVHMLAMLIQHQLRGASSMTLRGPAEGYRRLLGDPLQQVQRLLGHVSLATTSVYLDHIVTRADTVDTAVEELLALLPSANQS